MTFVELLLKLEEQNEKILSHEVSFLITEKFRYMRQLGLSDNSWEIDPVPGIPEKVYSRSGESYIWKRTDIDTSTDTSIKM